MQNKRVLFMLMRIRVKLPAETAARKTVPRTPLVPFDMANFVQKDPLLNVKMKTNWEKLVLNR